MVSVFVTFKYKLFLVLDTSYGQFFYLQLFISKYRHFNTVQTPVIYGSYIPVEVERIEFVIDLSSILKLIKYKAELGILVHRHTLHLFVFLNFYF